jgi:hypothetical protein
MLVIWTVFKNQSLQTPSFLFICSLALTDFGSGLITFPINASWRIVEFMDESANVCGTFDVGFAIAFTLLSASELTVTALTVERYLAIRLSIRYRQQVTNRRAVKVVVALWCIAIAWGVSSVFITPKVLHTTVVIVGFITFGTIFVCYALAFRALFAQESNSRALRLKMTKPNLQPSTTPCQSTWNVEEQIPEQTVMSPSSSRHALHEKETNLFAKRNFPLQVNMKDLPASQQHGSPVHKQVEINGSISCSWQSLTQSDLVKNTSNAPYKIVELEFDESHASINCYSCRKKHIRRSDSIGDFTVSPMSLANSSSTPETDENKKKTLCPFSIELCLTSNKIDSACEKTNKEYGRESASKSGSAYDEESCFGEMKKEEPRKNTPNYLKPRKKKLKLRAGTPVRLLKYRHTIVTLLWVVVMLILCYAPYFFLSFVVVFIGMTKEVAVAWSITITCMCINSLINPVIYLWRLRGLRKACLRTLKEFGCC